MGEYSHVRYDVRCSASLLNQLFGVCVCMHMYVVYASDPVVVCMQTLESVAYEMSINFDKSAGFTVRLVMILMSTMAKLASRSQDLIPRALLCLNKIVQRISVSRVRWCNVMCVCTVHVAEICEL